jgi:uncharacterized protein DUF3551
MRPLAASIQEKAMPKIVWIALLAASAAIGLAQPAMAQAEGPWCAHVKIGEGSWVMKCDMRSFEMCLAEIRGTGGSCSQNPRYAGEAHGARKQRAR